MRMIRWNILTLLLVSGSFAASGWSRAHKVRYVKTHPFFVEVGLLDEADGSKKSCRYTYNCPSSGNICSEANGRSFIALALSAQTTGESVRLNVTTVQPNGKIEYSSHCEFTFEMVVGPETD